MKLLESNCLVLDEFERTAFNCMKNQLNETWNSGNVLIHRIETGMSAPFKIGSSKRVCNWNQTPSLLTRPALLLYWNYWIVQTNWNSFKRTRSTIVSSPFLQTNRESKLCDSRFLRRFVRKAKKRTWWGPPLSPSSPVPTISLGLALPANSHQRISPIIPLTGK